MDRRNEKRYEHNYLLVNEVKDMNYKFKYSIIFILCVMCFMSMSVQAKMMQPELNSVEADYYIIEEASSKKPGEVSAKLKNQTKTIIIPETVEIKGKKYIVTEVTGFCYPDTLDNSLKQDAYKCKKNAKTTKIVLPKTIKKIQKGTFTNFSRLKTIKIDPNNKYFKVIKGSVLSKDGKTLYGTITLRGTYRIPKGVKTISSRAFAYSDVRKVILSKDCKAVKERAFYNCRKLKKIDGIKRVKKIEKGAFYNTKIKKYSNK